MKKTRAEYVKYGFLAEYRALAWLKLYFPNARIKTSYKDGHDIFVDGKRIEVKASRYHRIAGSKGWRFNIHRHGKLDESKVDAYLFVLDGVPEAKKYAIHLILPAPIGTKTVSISMRSLFNRYARYVNNFSVIGSPTTVKAHKQQQGCAA